MVMKIVRWIGVPIRFIVTIPMMALFVLADVFIFALGKSETKTNAVSTWIQLFRWIWDPDLEPDMWADYGNY